MIGSGLRKYATQLGMKVDHGVAYGFINGYATTFADGKNIKIMTVSTRFADPAALQAFAQQLQTLGWDKQYMISDLAIQEKLIRVVFTDNIGTVKRIEGFVAVFFPLLYQYGASRGDICSECGMILTDGKWKLVNGVAVYVHEACGAKIRASIQDENAERLSRGSYLSGTVGAILGAVLGSVVWTLISLLGYISALGGLAIGFFAEKGYNLLGGKKGWGKLVALIIAVLVGVVIGNLSSIVFYLVKDYGYSLGESISLAAYNIIGNPEVRSPFFLDTALGLLFAGLGVFGIMRKAKSEASGVSYIDLN